MRLSIMLVNAYFDWLYCSSQPSMVHWLISSIFPFYSSVRLVMVKSDQISTFFLNTYKHKSLVLTQFHLIPSSTKLYWPSTTKYQPVPPHTDHHHQILTSTAQYCHVSTSSASYWPSNIIYQLGVTLGCRASAIIYRKTRLYSDLIDLIIW